MDSSKSFSFGKNDSLNKECNGISNQIGPFKGQSPVVPQPMGSSPGHLQVDSSNKGSKYLMSSESLPNLGEIGFNLIPQENISLRSQDRTSGLRKDRNPAPPPEFSPRVCQFSRSTSISNDFQQLFYEARNIAEHTYFLISCFFDMSQIQTLEEFYRIIDSQISRLVLFASQSNDEFNVYEMVKALRVIQSRIEDKLISYFQNLEERDRMKVVFSLPQLRDHSYISVVNRSVTQSANSSVKARSLSPNSSLVKNSSNDFSYVRTSSPNKEEANVPEFNPPLEKIVQNKIISSVPYVPFVKSVSFAPSVSLVTSVPSAQNLPIVTSVPSAQNVPLVKPVPSIPSVPIVTSV